MNKNKATTHNNKSHKKNPPELVTFCIDFFYEHTKNSFLARFLIMVQEKYF